ncbi:MAG: deoxyribose-phosphate aldolase [Halobacteriovorax sp.]|nr:deoxyribose-phosphate aldolase [Halobacteriovorax sp.]
MTELKIEATIDHTLLKPEATAEQIKTLCSEAVKFNFKTVCINPQYIPLAKSLLDGTAVEICTVVGFPLGAMTSESKAFETSDAITKGAHEIDMVIAIGKLKSGELDYVEQDIAAVVQAARKQTVKVILETALLSADEIASACKLATKAGAHFVKTSTGFSSRGASLADIEIMKANISKDVKIKASGGIRSKEDALAYLKAGVSRLGTSSGVAIIQGEKSTQSY